MSALLTWYASQESQLKLSPRDWDNDPQDGMVHMAWPQIAMDPRYRWAQVVIANPDGTEVVGPLRSVHAYQHRVSIEAWWYVTRRLWRHPVSLNTDWVWEMPTTQTGNFSNLPSVVWEFDPRNTHPRVSPGDDGLIEDDLYRQVYWRIIPRDHPDSIEVPSYVRCSQVEEFYPLLEKCLAFPWRHDVGLRACHPHPGLSYGPYVWRRDNKWAIERSPDLLFFLRHFTMVPEVEMWLYLKWYHKLAFEEAYMNSVPLYASILRDV